MMAGKVLLLLAVGLMGVAAGAGRGAGASARPHLIFMMADQLRWDALGIVNPHAKTPALDSLAADGVQFTNAYTTTPTCTPARAALLTGQKPWNHGMLGYGEVAEKYPFEMPRALASIGYVTSSVGKDHFGWDNKDREGFPHGYDHTQLYDGIVDEPDEYHQWFKKEMHGKEPETGWPTLDMNSWRGAPYVYDEYYHPTAWVGRLAVDFISNYSDSRPMFLKVSFHRPHSPYDPPARVLNSISVDDLPPIVISKDGWDTRFSNLSGTPPGCGPKDPDAWCGLMPVNESTLARRAYYGSVAFVDEWVGQIIAALKQRGFYDNSIILWTADHGDGQGDHYHWRKGFPYEFSSHIPMLLKWAKNDTSVKVQPGSKLSFVTELRDVFPTMLDAAGAMDIIPQNYSMDGDSLLCLLRDPTGKACRGGSWREYLDLEHSTCYNLTNHWNGYVDGKTKYIFKAWNVSEQLFDLENDPGETVDLARDPAHQQELLMWRQRLIQQFETEKRGSKWVENGVLQRRLLGQTYSPNYPGSSSSNQTCGGQGLHPGLGIYLLPNAGEDPSHCQDFVVNTTLGFSALSMIARPDLCLARQNEQLDIEYCTKGNNNEYFSTGSKSDSEVSAAQVKHIPSGDCIVVTGVDESRPWVKPQVALQRCPKPSDKDYPYSEWIFGASGRLCHGSQGCLTVRWP